jgi:tetratricopeptide (TPR) repeat protein
LRRLKEKRVIELRFWQCLAPAIVILLFCPLCNAAFAASSDDSEDKSALEKIAQLEDGGDMASALAMLDQYLQKHPDSAEALNLKGMALWEIGNIPDAEVALTSATQADPNYAQSFINLGNLYVEERRYDMAKETYLPLTEMQPDKYYSFYAVGYACYYLQDYQSAVDYLQKAIALEPQNYYSWEMQAKAFTELGDWEQALDCWSFAGNLRDNRWEPYWCSAQLLARLQRPEEAFQQLAKAFALNSALSWQAKDLPVFAPYAENPEFKELIDSAMQGSSPNSGGD